MHGRFVNKEQLISRLFLACMSLLCYHLTLFRPLPLQPRFRSTLILCTFLTLSMIIGHILTNTHERTSFNVVITLLLPYELYTVFAYWAYFRHFRILLYIILFLPFLGSGLFFSCIPVHPRRSHSHSHVLFSPRLRKSLLVIRAIFTICGVLLIVLALILDINGGIPSTGSDKLSLVPHADSNIINENLDVLINLSEAHWDNLSLQEKLNVLQTVANIEKQRLGIPHDLLVTAQLLDDSMAGCYNHRNKTITIALSVLDRSFSESTPSHALEIITHECHHAYTHTLIELYESSASQYQSLSCFDAVREYKQEYSNYKNGSEGADFYDYYSQRVEIDARTYAQKATQEYIEAINTASLLVLTKQ